MASIYSYVNSQVPLYSVPFGLVADGKRALTLHFNYLALHTDNIST